MAGHVVLFVQQNKLVLRIMVAGAPYARSYGADEWQGWPRSGPSLRPPIARPLFGAARKSPVRVNRVCVCVCAWAPCEIPRRRIFTLCMRSSWLMPEPSHPWSSACMGAVDVVDQLKLKNTTLTRRTMGPWLRKNLYTVHGTFTFSEAVLLLASLRTDQDHHQCHAYHTTNALN